jgi:uncharacterized protein YcnI
VVWSGGKLPDAYYDEFVFIAALADDLEPGTIYLPVVQECEKGVQRWIETPAPDRPDAELREPAAPLKLLPPR